MERVYKQQLLYILATSHKHYKTISPKFNKAITQSSQLIQTTNLQLLAHSDLAFNTIIL